MDFLVFRKGSTTVVRTPPVLVITNRHELKQLILNALEGGDRQFVIDLRETAYVDSSGLGALVAIRKRVVQQGGELWLAHLSDDLAQLLSLTKLDTLLPRLDEDDEGSAGRSAPRLPRAPGPLPGSPEADLPPPPDFA